MVFELLSELNRVGTDWFNIRQMAFYFVALTDEMINICEELKSTPKEKQTIR